MTDRIAQAMTRQKGCEQDVFDAYREKPCALVSDVATATLLVRGVEGDAAALRAALAAAGAHDIQAVADAPQQPPPASAGAGRDVLVDVGSAEAAHAVVASTGGRLYHGGRALALHYATTRAADAAAASAPRDAAATAWQAWIAAAYAQYAAVAAAQAPPATAVVAAAAPVIDEAALAAQRAREAAAAEAAACARACAAIPPTVCLVCRRDLGTGAALERHFRSSALHSVCTAPFLLHPAHVAHVSHTPHSTTHDGWAWRGRRCPSCGGGGARRSRRRSHGDGGSRRRRRPSARSRTAHRSTRRTLARRCCRTWAGTAHAASARRRTASAHPSRSVLVPLLSCLSCFFTACFSLRVCAQIVANENRAGLGATSAAAAAAARMLDE